jgi:hypothetical protein
MGPGIEQFLIYLKTGSPDRRRQSSLWHRLRGNGAQGQVHMTPEQIQADYYAKTAGNYNKAHEASDSHREALNLIVVL